MPLLIPVHIGLRSQSLLSRRPKVPWSSGQDDYVLLARDPRAEAVRLTWVLTEDGNDAITTGELELPTAKAADAGELFKTAFLGNG